MLLGAHRALLESPLDLLLSFWVDLGTFLATSWVSWGVLWRSRGALGMSLVIVLMVSMPKSRKSHPFQTRMFTLLEAFAHLICTPTPSASITCASHLHISVADLIRTSHVDLSFAPLSFTSDNQVHVRLFVAPLI